MTYPIRCRLRDRLLDLGWLAGIVLVLAYLAPFAIAERIRNHHAKKGTPTP